jgi:proteasome lid subunit RPN8/RPN11
MKVILTLTGELHAELMEHLLPPRTRREQAALLFVRAVRYDGQLRFDTIEARKLDRADFAAQAQDYLEMADGTRASLIKRAHDLDASLVEVHSHPGPWPAAFSPADRMGLSETVPHMWWRLKKRPYLAVVVARSGFDALVWIDNAQSPRALDGILAGNRLLRPTNNSLGGWDDGIAHTV